MPTRVIWDCFCSQFFSYWHGVEIGPFVKKKEWLGGPAASERCRKEFVDGIKDEKSPRIRLWPWKAWSVSCLALLLGSIQLEALRERSAFISTE